MAKLLKSESDVEQVFVCHSACDSSYLSVNKATKIFPRFVCFLFCIFGFELQIQALWLTQTLISCLAQTDQEKFPEKVKSQVRTTWLPTSVCVGYFQSGSKDFDQVVGPMQRQLENMKWRFNITKTKKQQVFVPR